MCSTGKTDLARSIGADHVIDYTREDFADGRQHYDLILDIRGNNRLARLRRALTPTGTLVIDGGEGAKWTGVGRQLRALALSLRPPAADHVHLPPPPGRLDALRQLTGTGQLVPPVRLCSPPPGSESVMTTKTSTATGRTTADQPTTQARPQGIHIGRSVRCRPSRDRQASRPVAHL